MSETAEGSAAFRAAMGCYGLGVSAGVAGILAPGQLLSGGSRREFAERLGRIVPDVPRPWLVHAVSVGEMRAAGAFLEALFAERPGARVLLTTGNRDGRAAAERLRARYPGVEGVAFLPWDRPRVMERWLAALAPEALAIVETELWPGLFVAARTLQIPLFVVSGRLTDGEARRYRLARPFFREVLASARGIAAQSAEDRERFLAIGAPPERTWVGGNLKLDVPADAPTPAPPLDGREPLILAGSTHAPEERWLLAALSGLRPSRPGLRLVLAPRHPRRAARVTREARARGFTVTLSSEGSRDDWDVLVVDRLGLLPSLYARAAAAFVGGSLVPRGGQSPIEPAAAGVPIVMGGWDGNFREISAWLEQAGALVRVGRDEEPVSGLVRTFSALLGDRAASAARGERGRAVVEAGRGVALATVRRCLGLLSEGESKSTRSER